jgi:hypothetical protein
MNGLFELVSLIRRIDNARCGLNTARGMCMWFCATAEWTAMVFAMNSDPLFFTALLSVCVEFLSIFET